MAEPESMNQAKSLVRNKSIGSQLREAMPRARSLVKGMLPSAKSMGLLLDLETISETASVDPPSPSDRCGADPYFQVLICPY